MAPTAQHRSQAKYFDSEFASYSRYEPERWRQSFIRRIFGALEIDGNGPYLDVGVGGSGATVVEAGTRRYAPAVGCDLSIEGVVQARRFAVAEGVREAEFVACAAESLPFPDSSFACASSVAVLEHIDDDAVAARELGPRAPTWRTSVDYGPERLSAHPRTSAPRLQTPRSDAWPQAALRSSRPGPPAVSGGLRPCMHRVFRPPRQGRSARPRPTRPASERSAVARVVEARRRRPPPRPSRQTRTPAERRLSPHLTFCASRADVV